ncbi:MAG: serine hydrolase [Bacteroidota bacterium]|nr:MAG: serine hydrolase [Bacteroidota bacterium]
MQNIIKIVPFFLILSFGSCGQDNHTKKIQKLVDYYIKDYKFNGNVIIYEDDKLIFQQSQGFVDYKTKRKLDFNIPFSIGSVTKTFTATCIMILKEQGKLNYTDTIGKFIQDLPHIINRISIQQLLT